MFRQTSKQSSMNFCKFIKMVLSAYNNTQIRYQILNIEVLKDLNIEKTTLATFITFLVLQLSEVQCEIFYWLGGTGNKRYNRVLHILLWAWWFWVPENCNEVIWLYWCNRPLQHLPENQSPCPSWWKCLQVRVLFLCCISRQWPSILKLFSVKFNETLSDVRSIKLVNVLNYVCTVLSQLAKCVSLPG